MLGSLLCLASGSATAMDLLLGTVRLDDASEVAFSLSGESRANVVGGEIRLGERRYAITRMSLHRLIGADRIADDGAGKPQDFAEHVVFSSSFSKQTGVGKPWVAAQAAVRCDEPYNSFLAVYTLDDLERDKALGAIPYSKLTDDIGSSDRSVVYCFMSLPPDRLPEASTPSR